MSEDLQIMTQLYHNAEFSRSYFYSRRAAEVCTQTLHLLHADPIEMWGRSYSHLGLSYR